MGDSLIITEEPSARHQPCGNIPHRAAFTACVFIFHICTSHPAWFGQAVLEQVFAHIWARHMSKGACYYYCGVVSPHKLEGTEETLQQLAMLPSRGRAAANKQRYATRKCTPSDLVQRKEVTSVLTTSNERCEDETWVGSSLFSTVIRLLKRREWYLVHDKVYSIHAAGRSIKPGAKCWCRGEASYTP